MVRLVVCLATKFESAWFESCHSFGSGQIPHGSGVFRKLCSVVHELCYKHSSICSHEECRGEAVFHQSRLPTRILNFNPSGHQRRKFEATR